MNTHINLLPQQFRRGIVVRRRLLQWSIVFAVICVAVVGVWYQKHSRLSATRQELAQMEARCRPLRQTDQQNRRLQTRITQMRGRQSLLVHLDAGVEPLQVIGQVSRSAQFGGGRLRVDQMTFQYVESPPPVSTDDNKDDKAKAPAPIKLFRLTLGGIASNNLAVSKFIVALRESGFFGSVELKSSERTELAEGRARKFLVECAM